MTNWRLGGKEKIIRKRILRMIFLSVPEKPDRSTGEKGKLLESYPIGYYNEKSYTARKKEYVIWRRCL